MAWYGRDYMMRGNRERYALDYDRTADLGRNARYWGRDFDRIESGRDFDRFDRTPELNRGYGARRNPRYDLDYGERMTFRAGERGRERDWGDRLREGWDDVQRGARRMMGRGYDRGW